MNRSARRDGHIGRQLLLVSSLFLFVVALWAPSPTSAQTTAWVGTTGDWGNAANWSDGVPTSTVDAEVTIASTPTVTAMGEECRNLTLAVDVGGATIRVNSGSLGIGELLLLSSNAFGTMAQYGGTVSAAWAVIGDPNRGNNPTITMTNFTMFDSAILSVAVGQLGVGTIVVSGTATLAGQIQVLDVLASDGSYEVLRGNPLQGDFSLSFLPPNWSWKVEGNSLYVVKGMVPAESDSWGHVKADYHR